MHGGTANAEQADPTDHERGAHAHSPSHSHGEHPEGAHHHRAIERSRRALAPRFSLLRTSVTTRLIGAAGLSGLIWLGVFWALR